VKENTGMRQSVYIVKTESRYPDFPFDGRDGVCCALGDLFSMWGLDPENPFKDLIRPGETALIKPNWVTDRNPLGHSIDSLTTHSSVITHIVELILRAMDYAGTIIIGDAPIQNCDFDGLLKATQFQKVLDELKIRYREAEIIVEDWRLTTLDHQAWLSNWRRGAIQHARAIPGKERGESHILVDLGRESFLEDIVEYCDDFRVANYNCRVIRQHHCPGRHEYLVTRRIHDAKLIINLPKMKTHKKAGMTGALKNIVGINGHKEYLPHYIRGSYFDGGDNYCLPNRMRERYEDLYDYYWERTNDLSRLKRRGAAFLLKYLWRFSRLLSSEHISDGGWRGNDTLWRTILDLNHLLYFNRQRMARGIFTIVDGIIAGEGEGPLTPTPRKTGILIGGENPAYIDAVIAKMMGYNIARLPMIYHAINHRRSCFGDKALEEMEIISMDEGRQRKMIGFCELPDLDFRKPFYWRGAAAKAKGVG
jgi:uncharacterized protein (DUF362 family)